MASTLTGTTPYIIDILKEHLAKVRGECNAVTTEGRKQNARALFGDRKYYNQAFELLNEGACNPVPEYLINLSDLTPELKKELSDLDTKSLDFVLKQTVGWIFEDINSWIYHTSVSKVLKVRIAE
jgi:hypothetical protein